MPSGKLIGDYPEPENRVMSWARKDIQTHMSLQNMYPTPDQMKDWIETAYLGGWEFVKGLTSEIIIGPSSNYTTLRGRSLVASLARSLDPGRELCVSA